jgi:hypothetical protein
MNFYKYVNAIIYGRNDYPPKVRDILANYGDKKIKAMEVRREPLPLVLNTALNVVTLGKIARNNPYDKLFHLSLVIQLEDNNSILIEKNEVISMEVNPLNRENTEAKEVALYKQLIFKDMMTRTQERMGDRFFIYSARNENCQDFIWNILVANNLDTNELYEFIKQDAIKIYGDMIRFRKFSNTLTDIAGRLNVVTQGYGELSRRNGLSNIDIEEMLKDVKNFGGVFMKDELPNRLNPNTWYIVNLENHRDGDGTHWTCFRIQKTGIEYYDALGFPPPMDVLTRTKGAIYWSPKQIQAEKSTACGYFCVARITSNLPFQKFIDYFSNDPSQNDFKLKEMLMRNGFT